MHKNKKTGFYGENIAKEFMEKKGYAIIDKNFYCPFGEIDLIAVKNEETVFVEVKTRKSDSVIPAQACVDGRKHQRLIKTANFYISKNSYLQGKSWRLDFIAIELDSEKKVSKIDHFHALEVE